MKTRIFTPLERNAIQQWLNGETADAWRKIKHRILHFRDLEEDVKLYLKVKEKLKQG